MCLFCGPSGRASLDYRTQQSRPLTTAELLAGPADVVLTCRRVLTMDAARPEATALSLRQGLIQTVGTLDEAMSRKGRMTRIIDLEDRILVPGLVLSDLPKDPVDFLDWQSLDCSHQGKPSPESLRDHGVMPSMFGEPVLVRLGSSAPDGYGQTLAALASLCGNAPVAVALPERREGFANEAMLRCAQCDPSSLRDDALHGFRMVADLPALLRPIAERQQFSPGTVLRGLETQLAAAAAMGYTTLVDRQMGALAGSYEIDAAAAILRRTRRIRLNVAAHGRLRREWDGTIPEDVPAGRLSIDCASVDLDEPAQQLAQELPSLHAAGWRMAFRARTDEQLDTLLPILSGIASQVSPDLSRHRIEAGFTPVARRRAEIDALGVMLAIEPREGASGECEPDRDPLWPLAALTVAAAGRRGIRDVAGTIDVGRRADLTVLEAMPLAGEALRIQGTWLDGAPV